MSEDAVGVPEGFAGNVEHHQSAQMEFETEQKRMFLPPSNMLRPFDALTVILFYFAEYTAMNDSHFLHFLSFERC